MKYTEQAVETLDDAGCVIANKNIEIEQLRQRVQELENERLEQQEKLCGCIVNLGQLRAERDEWEANSGQWEQEYYKVCKERDEIAVEARRKQRNWISVCEERDALTKQRDELVAALEPFVKYNSSKSVIDLAIRTSDITKARAAIASVKEKA